MKLPSPFPPISVYKTGQLRRQGSSMNSLRSALTTHLSGPGNLRSGRSRTTMAVLEIAKSVYHVPGTLWILCPGLDRDSSRPFGGCVNPPHCASDLGSYTLSVCPPLTTSHLPASGDGPSF